MSRLHLGPGPRLPKTMKKSASPADAESTANPKSTVMTGFHAAMALAPRLLIICRAAYAVKATSNATTYGSDCCMGEERWKVTKNPAHRPDMSAIKSERILHFTTLMIARGLTFLPRKARSGGGCGGRPSSAAAAYCADTHSRWRSTRSGCGALSPGRIGFDVVVEVLVRIEHCGFLSSKLRAIFRHDLLHAPMWLVRPAPREGQEVWSAKAGWD